jgi:hypothetical protein
VISAIAHSSRHIVALAMSSMLVLAASVSPSNAQALPQHLFVARSAVHNDILVMLWRGRIEAPMSAEISAAFEQNKNGVKGVVLKLDSEGGSVAEGERVIGVLREIKKTHKLHTVVGPGRKCGSMCVFIYVQGQKRLAAPASLWLFHEVSFKDPKTHLITRLDRNSWERLVDKYWLPAGVDQKWIESVKAHTIGSDYWQSGENLLRDGSNIIQQSLSDEQRRIVRSSATLICRRFSAVADDLVEIPCK